MQLTTPQTYALAVLAVLTIILIGISYISGLRTGQAAARRDAQKKREQYIELYEQEKAAHSATVTDLNIARNGHWAALEQTKLSHDATEKARQEQQRATAAARGLSKQLEAEERATARLLSKVLNADDLLTLQLAARQLGQAAKQHARTGTNKPNQAGLAQTALKEILDRLTEAAPNPEPSQVIEQPKQKAARDEDGFLLPPRIDYIGDGKSTWERIDDEHRAQGLPAPQCM